MRKISQQALDVDSLIEDENIIVCDLKDEIESSMLSYSLLTILDRALPDPRDGLKPVERRILHCCKEQNYVFEKPHVKNAKIVGDVIGSYHPHGSCYGTLVKLSQPWSLRYPLIDFHGNNGSLDGDGPAAFRYTEGRLNKLSYELLEDELDKHCVPFKSNYDETRKEPEVLPALLPNFLLNGAYGIAVGYATNVPSHNLNELCDGISYAIKHDDVSVEELMKYISGPDFPSGSLMLEDGIKELYSTGYGKLSFRAKYEVEENHENKNPQIVFSELPPAADRPSIIEKIHLLCITNKDIARVVGIRDESKGMTTRIVVELQKTANVNSIIADLFAKTQLEKQVTYNMRATVGPEPKVLSLKEAVSIYIEHRREVMFKRLSFLISDIVKKIEIQNGLFAVTKSIKKAVNIITDCEDDIEAKQKLIEEYKISDMQADSVLDMKLRKLTKLDKNKIKDLISSLEEKLSGYKTLISDKELINQEMISQLKVLKEKFGDKRRTTVIKEFESVEQIKEETKITTSPDVVICFGDSFKLYYLEDFEKLIKKRTLRDKKNIFKQCLQCKTYDDIIVVNKDSTCIKVVADDFKYINMNCDNVLAIFKYDENSTQSILCVLKNGTVKKTPINKFKLKKDKNVEIIKEIESEIVALRIVEDNEDEVINLATNNGIISRFSCNSFNSTSINSKSIPSIKLKDDDFIVDVEISLRSEDEVNKLIIYSENIDNSKIIKTMNLSELLVKGRISNGLQCTFDKQFKTLNKIIISDGDYAIFDVDGNIVNCKLSTDIKNRMAKGEEYEVNISNNKIIL